MRSDQLSVAWPTVAGTTNDWVMFLIAGPVGLVTASKLPEIGGWGVAGLAGSRVPLLICQVPRLVLALKTVQPAKVPVSKPPLVIRFTGCVAVAVSCPTTA